ncbi:MAG TPA: aminodeoxychorismate/anthranilate synthase component II [Gammaproteobacteria bacterium]|nr:aminodeoxychorismate/anthranilate synthase component II [Xanthomonadales bacterium]MCB1594476.1 aminodeoxychorismate/anthranilate synthase component II [Xanthomonadales bacterium]HOP22301.1 aminodeoxychorismate/anthranilate synthase component II [Gammaproteobacteria bacterium]HPI96421.1 aminodeoxychorismate/anthranilate synthase component II [Gammaproteobacteria bacterium]HPQ87213.1 aminodeoxychorismate/anthranilate synthase component II [Gammaproteobacteria bacterium]
MLLMIDNYDSFTYNLVQYFGELGCKVKVFRNDEISVEDALALNPKQVVISPGPCDPDLAGISMQMIKACAGKIPVLGVCLGHQSIGQVFGGKVIRAKQIMHGKTSPVYHKNNSVFTGIENPVKVTRYHSLVVEKETLPDCLEITAWTEDENGDFDEIMGFRHKEYAISGVQFHPESILTEQGHQMLQNFLDGKY